MAEKIEILIKARDEATKELRGITGHIQGMSKQLRIAGAAMAATGAGIVLGMGMAVKAAAKEEAGIVRLSEAMGNMGLSYEGSRESLEAWIDTQQQKTAIADDEQRDSLAQLIRLSGNLTEAQDLLTLAMDMAIGTGRDLASTTTLIQYAVGGNWGMVERMIPALKQAKTEEEKWILVRKLFSGQAEAYGKTMDGQMKLMQHNIGDIKEAIGALIIESIAPLVQSLTDVLPRIKEWIADNQGLTRMIVLVTAAVGLILIPLGALLMLLPGLSIAVAAFGAALHLALGPVGWIVLGITALVAGVALLWNKMGETAREIKAQATEMYDWQTEMARSFSLEQTEIARQSLIDQKAALDENLEAVRFAHEERLGMLDEEYRVALQNIDARTAAELSAIQEQIDAINSQTKEEGRALQKRRDAEAVAELKLQIKREEDAKRRKALTQRLSDMLAGIERRKLLESRDIEKQSLREQMVSIRAQADEERDVLAIKLEEDREYAQLTLETTEKRIEEEAALLDAHLTETLAMIEESKVAELDRIEVARVEVEKAEKAKLEALKDRLDKEYEETKAHYDRMRALRESAASGGDSSGVGAGPPSPSQSGPVMHEGGTLDATGWFYGQRGETILPVGTKIIIHNSIYLDSTLIAEQVNERLADEAMLRSL